MRGDVVQARAAADDALLEELGKMLRRADPLPPRLMAASRNLLAWRTLDAELDDLLRRGAPPRPPDDC
jgi:hypothetical protein